MSKSNDLQSTEFNTYVLHVQCLIYDLETTWKVLNERSMYNPMISIESEIKVLKRLLRDIKQITKEQYDRN